MALWVKQFLQDLFSEVYRGMEVLMQKDGNDLLIEAILGCGFEFESSLAPDSKSG